MHVMTRKAGHLVASVKSDIANVFQNMPIGRIKRFEVLVGPINVQIAEEVVSRDKGVRVGQTGAAGFSRPNVALAANRRDDARRVPSPLRENNLRCIFAVFQPHVAVAGETVQRDGGERLRLRVNGRRVTPGTRSREYARIPMGTLRIDECCRTGIGGRPPGRRQRGKLTVPVCPLSDTHAVLRAHHEFDFVVKRARGG